MKEVNWEEYIDRFIPNLDERMLKQKGRSVAMVHKDTKVALIRKDGNTENIMIMSWVAANGDFMISMFIFPMKNTPLELEELVKSEKLTISGQVERWTEQFIDIIEKRRKDFKISDAKALLFIHAHSSSRKEVQKSLKWPKEENCHCITYPPDSTPILQSVDIGIFENHQRSCYSRLKCYLERWDLRIKL